MRRYLKIIMIALILAVNVNIAYCIEGDTWKTTSNATVREKPDANSRAISWLKKDIVVKEIEQYGKWVKIKSKSGTTGWVHKSALTPLISSEEDMNSQVTEEVNKIALKKAQESGCSVQNESCIITPKTAMTFDQLTQEQRDALKQKVEQRIINQEQQQKEKMPVNSPIPPVKVENPQNTFQQKSVTSQTPKKEINIDQLLKGTEIDSKMEQKLSQASLPVPLPDNFQQSGLPANSYIVSPEKMTAVKMSSSDINRIVCQTDIKDVVFSEEKGVQVKISGPNAFVKFVIKRIGEREMYSKIPVDMYVVCGNKVYNIIGIPEKIPSVTVYLEDKESKIKEVLERNTTIPYEKRIVNYVKAFMSGQIPPESVFIGKNLSYPLYQDIDIVERGVYNIEGEGIAIRFFNVIGKKSGVEIREKDFLRKEITQNPLAISLDKLKLNLNEKAILLIVEKIRG